MTEADLDYVMGIERAAAQERFVWEWSREQHEEGLKAPGRLHLIIESVSAGRSPGREARRRFAETRCIGWPSERRSSR